MKGLSGGTPVASFMVWGEAVSWNIKHHEKTWMFFVFPDKGLFR